MIWSKIVTVAYSFPRDLIPAGTVNPSVSTIVKIATLSVTVIVTLGISIDPSSVVHLTALDVQA